MDGLLTFLGFSLPCLFFSRVEREETDRSGRKEGGAMGLWCSKENQSGGRQPHDYNHNHNHNHSNGAAAASKGGKNRYAKIGDDYHTLEQVKSIAFFLIRAAS